MALSLQAMPLLSLEASFLKSFGDAWATSKQKPLKQGPYSASALGKGVADKVASSLSVFLGDIAIETPQRSALTPAKTNCVEVGSVRVVGGLRAQDFDVGYRPDGIRFAYNTKTLNDPESVMKNWRNMINDLATEALSVHTRFPHAVVAFIVLCPVDSLSQNLQEVLIGTLERLTGRVSVSDQGHKAEAISFVYWDKCTGAIDQRLPKIGSPLRLDCFSSLVSATYEQRYRGFPPHI